jgi:hypothetical protein
MSRLAKALGDAAAAGRFDVVAQLANELEGTPSCARGKCSAWRKHVASKAAGSGMVEHP